MKMELLVLTGVFLASPATAQVKKGDSILKFELGAGLPVSEIDPPGLGGGEQTPGNAGLAVDGQYIYHVTNHWGLGAEIQHMDFDERDFSPPGITISGGLLTMEGIGRYLFTPEKKVSPYLIGGIGFNRFTAQAHEIGEPGDIRLDQDSLGPTVSAGGGVEGSLTRNLIASAEARWRLASIDSDKFGDNWFNALGFMAGLGWKFQ